MVRTRPATATSRTTNNAPSLARDFGYDRFASVSWRPLATADDAAALQLRATRRISSRQRCRHTPDLTDVPMEPMAALHADFWDRQPVPQLPRRFPGQGATHAGAGTNRLEDRIEHQNNVWSVAMMRKL